MTFSICARERYEDDEENSQYRFGAAVTTRRPTVGARCLWGNSAGVIITQGHTNPLLGRRGIRYLSEGLKIADTVCALLAIDDDTAHRQVHGLDAHDEFVHTGTDCPTSAGAVVEDGLTVAGNTLTSEDVLRATADAAARSQEGQLIDRLIAGLEAGQEAGGDHRHDRRIQSAAALVRTTADDGRLDPLDHDLRIDASPSPIADLKDTLHTVRTVQDGENEE